ncbi:MAG: DUF427 domain-containing protein [Planctomycetota bacterium]
MIRKAPQPVAPQPGQESVWQYPRPPALEPCSRPIRVVCEGVTVADTRGAMRVLETSHPPTYYLPPDDVRIDLLERIGGGSFCEWKGAATYWTLRLPDRTIDRCAWSYAAPTTRFSGLQDYFAFYAPLMDACYVGDEQATPQPGGFYGGWVTSDLAGPFKGEPGTEHW